MEGNYQTENFGVNIIKDNKMKRLWSELSIELIDKIIKELKNNPILTLNQGLEKYEIDIKEISELCKSSDTYRVGKMGEIGEEYFFNMKKFKNQMTSSKMKLYSILFLDLLDKKKRAPSALHVLGAIQFIFPQISRALEEDDI